MYDYIITYSHTILDSAVKSIKSADEFDACLEMLEYYKKEPDLIRAKVKMLPVED